MHGLGGTLTVSALLLGLVLETTPGRAAEPQVLYSANCVVPRLATDTSSENSVGGTAPVSTLTRAEVIAAYNCVKPLIQEAFARSDEAGAVQHLSYRAHNSQPYASSAHGGHLVNTYANATARAYGRFDEAGPMPIGSRLFLNSLAVRTDGVVGIGPLYKMTKMPPGHSPDTGDWRFSMIMPDGETVGASNGANAESVRFCADCHQDRGDHDLLFFPPTSVRRE